MRDFARFRRKICASKIPLNIKLRGGFTRKGSQWLCVRTAAILSRLQLNMAFSFVISVFYPENATA
jgi:hypothetical protein